MLCIFYHFLCGYTFYSATQFTRDICKYVVHRLIILLWIFTAYFLCNYTFNFGILWIFENQILKNMAVYTGLQLRRIISFLPRRPAIPADTFKRLKELSIFRSYRGPKTKYNSTGGKIPVVLTNRLTPQNSIFQNSSNNSINNRNLTNISTLKKITPTSALSCGVLNCRSVNNKASFIQDTILDFKLDCAALTETWLSHIEENNRVTISNLLPDNYDILHVPRKSRGGGVGFVFKNHLKTKLDFIDNFTSFECCSILVQSQSATIRFIVLYRTPPSSKNNIKKSTFISEFADLLEQSSTFSGRLVLIGDFNVHFNSVHDSERIQLTALLDRFGLIQHVSGATHTSGHTLDLVITRATDDIVQRCEVGPFISDHNMVLFNLKSGNEHSNKKQIKCRKIKAITKDDMIRDIKTSLDQLPIEMENVNILVSSYNSVLSNTLDKHAPIRTCTVAERSTVPWMTDAILEAKRVRRKHERLWRNSGLTVHRQQYRFSCEHVKTLIQKSKSDYYVKQIEECEGDQKKLFQVIDKVLGRRKSK